MNEAKRIARRLAGDLEEYLDHPQRYGGGLDPATQEVADTLRQAAQAESPRPGFINEVAQQLRQKDLEMKDEVTPSAWARLTRLALSGVALAALIAVALYAGGLFRAPILEPTIGELGTPEMMETFQPTEGPFAGHQLQITTGLEDGPKEARLYRVSGAPLPDTVEGALELGRALGLENPQVYETPQDPGRWIVRDDSGASVSYRPGDPTRPALRGALYYSGFEQSLPAEGEPMPFADAARVAVDFLQQAQLLSAEYEIVEQPSAAGAPLQLVNIVPLVDGLPLDTDQAPTQVGVLPGGVIAHAQVNPITVAPSDEVVPLKSARQALDDLLQDRGGYSFSYDNVMPGGQRQRIFYPQMATPQSGDRVSIEGWLSVLIAVTDGQTKAMLYGAPQGTRYELAGPALGELVEAGGSQVRVEGSIVDVRESGELVLEVDGWQSVSSPAPPAGCRSGVFSREGQRALLQADNGDTFELGEVDPELSGGERIEVCAGSFEGESVAWQYIVSPPSGELDRGSGSGGGSSGTAVQAVEVTRVVEIDGSGGSESRQVAEQVVTSSGISSSPYAIGDEVQVSGAVGGYLRREGDRLVPNLQLGIDVDDDPFTPALYLPLYGEQALLEELSQYNRLYVEVRGVVVEPTGEMPGPENQAIRLESFQPPEDSEGIQAFLGHIEQQTLDGREVTVLVDAENDARYVLAQDFGSAYEEGKIWVSGILHPQAELAGLPVLEPMSMSAGSEVDAAESASDIPLETEMPVMEDRSPAASGGLPSTMVVERVTLGYTLNPNAAESVESMDGETLVPTWLFYGRSADGLTTFVLRLDATQ